MSRRRRALRKRAASSASTSIVHHTKWGRVAAATFCRTERIDTVITDVSAPVEMVDSLYKLGIRVHLVGPGSTGAQDFAAASGPSASNGGIA